MTHAAADEVSAICDDSGARFVIIHRDLLEALRPALKGLQIIAVKPGQALCKAYYIDPSKANDGADLPQWRTLVEAKAPLPERTAMRPLLRYTSGSTGKPKGVRRLQAGPRRDFEDVLHRVGTKMLQLKPESRFFTAAPIYHSAPPHWSALP